MASPKVLECLVCREGYDDQNLCPRMLSCGHSFCTRCLDRLFTEERDKFRCPTCRVEVNVSQDGVIGLPKNFALLSIFDVKPQQESLFDCEVCDDKHPAIFYCFNCKEDMCKDAARFHSRSKGTCDHQLISLESATATELCSKHNEPFRFFVDRPYGYVVCRRCIERYHYKCSSLAEAASKCRQEMQELATKVNARSEVIKTAEARVKQANLDMKKKYEEQEVQIHGLFREIYAAITAREESLTNELKELYSSKAAILTEQQDRLREFQESVASTVQGILSRIQSSGDAELLVGRSALEATLRETENQPMMLEPKVQFVPKVLFNHSRRKFQNLLDALNEEVYVTDDLTCAKNTIAEGNGLESAVAGRNNSFTIIAHDVRKHRRTVGGDLFKVDLECEAQGWSDIASIGNVEDRGDGSYLATYSVCGNAEPGTYMVNVYLHGVHIHGSPFRVKLTWDNTFLKLFPYWITGEK